MSKNRLKVLLISAFVVIGICCTQVTPPGNNVTTTNVNSTKPKIALNTAPSECMASADWITKPQQLKEVPGEDTGNPTICGFHQFSWQWFLALMNQPQGAPERAFEDEKNYPLLLASDQNSCVENAVQSRVFVRSVKDDDGPHDDFILPERIDQAAKANNAVIYDQNGNVVLYEVRFSRSECSVDKAGTMFPAGTTELKISYRVITEAEKSSYIWINPEVNTGKPQPEKLLLGMVGFHLAITTPKHPEFIWASFEHKQTAPECQAAPVANAKYAFTSAQCAAQLPNSVNPQNCDFNLVPTATPNPTPTPGLTGGKPTQICKAYHAGSKQGDLAFDANVKSIDQLNEQLTGPNGLIAKSTGAPSMTVLQNYQLIGTLWLIDPSKSSQQPVPTPAPGQPTPSPTLDVSNQVGSLQLANPTMETTFQQFKIGNGGEALPVGYTGNQNMLPAANCFYCHRYEATPNNPQQPFNNVVTSHIFPGIFGKTN